MPNSDTDRRPTPERFSGLVPGFPGAGGAHGAAVRRCLAGGAGLAPIAHGAVVVILGLPLPKRGAPAPVGSPRADVAAAAALRSASLIASASASKRGRSATVSPASSSPIERALCGASSLPGGKKQQWSDRCFTSTTGRKSLSAVESAVAAVARRALRAAQGSRGRSERSSTSAARLFALF